MRTCKVLPTKRAWDAYKSFEDVDDAEAKKFFEEAAKTYSGNWLVHDHNDKKHAEFTIARACGANGIYEVTIDLVEDPTYVCTSPYEVS